MATSDHTTIQIQLTRGYVATVDSCDADLATLKWHAQTKKNYTTYAVREIRLSSGKESALFIHRVILARMLGRQLTQGEFVDHIDGDGTNNRRENLRLADKSQNGCNRGVFKHNTSGFKGVSWNKEQRKWTAYITKNGRRMFLGYFVTAEEAHEAYCLAAVKYHGEFGRTK